MDDDGQLVIPRRNLQELTYWDNCARMALLFSHYIRVFAMVPMTQDQHKEKYTTSNLRFSVAATVNQQSTVPSRQKDQVKLT